MRQPSGAINPSMADLTLYAFQLVGLRPTSLVQEHIESARMATNMLMARWSAEGINLWQIQRMEMSLKKGLDMYSLPDDIVALLDCYVTQKSTTGKGPDRIILPIGRTEYASFPNKLQTGFPTVFWFNQILSPNVNVRTTVQGDTRITQTDDVRVSEPIDNQFYIWPTPPSDDMTLTFYYMKQLPPADMQGARGPWIPMYFLEAFAMGLAARLAMIWAPDKAQILKAEAAEAYQVAAEQNVEDTAYYLSPQTAGYFR